MRKINLLLMLFPAILGACATPRQASQDQNASYLQTVNTATNEVWMQITLPDRTACKTLRDRMLDGIPELDAYLRCSPASASDQLPVYADGHFHIEVQTEEDCQYLADSGSRAPGSSSKTCITKSDITLSDAARREARYRPALCDLFSTPKRQRTLRTEKETQLAAQQTQISPETFSAKRRELDLTLGKLDRANFYFDATCRPRLSCMTRPLDRKLCKSIEATKEKARFRLNQAIAALERFQAE